MVGAALLTAYHNAGGKVELWKALPEMYHRGKEVPGGACGFGEPAEQGSVRGCICRLLQNPLLWQKKNGDCPIR